MHPSRKVEFLSRPQTYPDQRQPVEVIETHFAWVFLTERHAYKMKKPLRQDALDYRSLASRLRGCRNEVRLNRRLAPTVYLDVVPLGCAQNGRLVLGSTRRVVDWLVKMRRLPATRMLDRCIGKDAVGPRDRAAVVNLFARFYTTAKRMPMRPVAYLRQLQGRLDQSASVLCHPELGLERVTALEAIGQLRRFIDSNAPLLRSRAARIVEGHGDLRPEHIYLGSPADGPAVIDCLEFDARLRRLDPVQELAFLALECRRLGAESLGQSMLRSIQRVIGDAAPESLIHFYEGQQALTRAMIAAWRLRVVHAPGRARRWRHRADSYLGDALHFARLAHQPGKPKLTSARERSVRQSV